MSTQSKTNNDPQKLITTQVSPTVSTDELPRLQVSVADAELQEQLYELSGHIREIVRTVAELDTEAAGSTVDSTQTAELTTDNVHVDVEHTERREATTGDSDTLRGNINGHDDLKSFYYHIETVYTEDETLGNYRATKAIISRNPLDKAELLLADIEATGFYLLAEDKVDRTDVYVLPGGDVGMTLAAVNEAIHTIKAVV